MLICLLVFQLRGPVYVIVALVSGIAAVFVSLILPGNAYVIIASVTAATKGLFLSRKTGTEKRET